MMSCDHLLTHHVTGTCDSVELNIQDRPYLPSINVT